MAFDAVVVAVRAAATQWHRILVAHATPHTAAATVALLAHASAAHTSEPFGIVMSVEALSTPQRLRVSMRAAHVHLAAREQARHALALSLCRPLSAPPPPWQQQIGRCGCSLLHCLQLRSMALLRFLRLLLSASFDCLAPGLVFGASRRGSNKSSIRRPVGSGGSFAARTLLFATCACAAGSPRSALPSSRRR